MAEKSTPPQESPHLQAFKKFLSEKHALSRPLADWELRILGGFGGYQSQANAPAPHPAPIKDGPST